MAMWLGADQRTGSGRGANHLCDAYRTAHCVFPSFILCGLTGLRTPGKSSAILGTCMAGEVYTNNAFSNASYPIWLATQLIYTTVYILFNRPIQYTNEGSQRWRYVFLTAIVQHLDQCTRKRRKCMAVSDNWKACEVSQHWNQQLPGS